MRVLAHRYQNREWDRRSLLGRARTLPVSRAKPVNRAAIAHATNGPFWVTHCSMANEMGSGNCGRLIARANLLRFQAIQRSAALRHCFLGRRRLFGAPDSRAELNIVCGKDN
jgi:hypothetical protein